MNAATIRKATSRTGATLVGLSHARWDTPVSVLIILAQFLIDVIDDGGMSLSNRKVDNRLLRSIVRLCTLIMLDNRSRQ